MICVSQTVLPDNVRLSKRDTYWVAGANVVSIFGKAMVKLPALRQASAGLFPSWLLK